ncbi:hypothetical protein WK90_09210 [Burkholderia cepacia]|nr:hypothetical protein WJ46_16815 [Burkholderia cepacia]KVQ25851.1 hypothetical protein WK02_27295 [Burkholderia cepacia]KVV62008.1 hypothetical protein WK84_30310 [Burkholderia cepacia]KVV62797.1 hypothetical protein WK85_03310 [Burkholderia cepacia]KVV66704.1 hypothetical protein WK83_03090 [Burkholderia cepacia]
MAGCPQEHTMNEKDFFAAFEAERWNFTFMDEEDTKQPVQQVGLVAVFYLVDAYLPMRRKHIAEAFALYDKHFGDKLQGGYRGDMDMTIQPYRRDTFTACYAHITEESAMNAIEFSWMSRPSFGHVSDYMFGVYSPAGWFEQVHKPMTVVRFYLPIKELSGGGKERFEQLLAEFCQLLRPLHGAAGLAIQECHEWEDFQHTEYESAWAYRGLDVCGPLGSERWRSGYRSLNWYTYLAHHWLAKLGTPNELKAKFDDDRIATIPYEWGSMIRAGDWPQLGKAEVDPKPELYVKVNEAIKPLRVDDIGSLHYGSVGGEVRFNQRTSNLWLRRFDLPLPPPMEPTVDPSVAKGDSRRFLRIASGTPCPWPGVWQCVDAEHLGPQTIAYGIPMPEIDGRAVRWRLIKAI